MIYKFKSKATGDLIMLGPNGDQLLRIMGREPAPQGIIEVQAMAAAIAALEAAVQADEATSATDGATPGQVSLRQRAWPMIEMLKRALPQEQPVVWGV
jgi:hypothetical protein